MSGLAEDGFDFGGSLGNGNYTLVAEPSINATPYTYIPVPASATYVVTNNSSLNITVQFVQASPCFQTYTEVGLPFGAEWWVIEDVGLAFFSNGSIIDAIGCPAMGGVSIGSATDYRVIAFPTTTFYPGGASIPVAFAPPPTVSLFPALDVASLGVVMGVFVAIAYAMGGHPPRPPTKRDHPSDELSSEVRTP